MPLRLLVLMLALSGLSAAAYAQQRPTACIEHEGRVICGPLVSQPAARTQRSRRAERSSAPRSQCVTNYGRTVCGYDCVANYGQAACAQTPYGACHANYGRVQCWDPPTDVSRYPNARPAECISNYGQIACGWSCVANYGRISCASTP